MTGKSRGRSVRRAVVVAVMFLFVILVLDGLYVAAMLPSPARAIVDEATAGRDRLGEADFDGARDEFDHALEHVDRASGLLRHPAAFVARALPRVGSDVRALSALVDSSGDAARAGLEVVDAAEALGATDEGLAASVYRDGRVRLGALEAAAPSIGRAAALMKAGLERVEAAPEPSFAVVRSARSEALRLLTEGARGTRRAEEAFEVLPGMLGGDGRRRYFLMFQAPSEARGTGGLLGFYGLLQADRGRLDLAHVGPIEEVSSPRRFRGIDAPGWYRNLYGPLGALREWRQVNTSINFPAVAAVALQMYESSTGDVLDGVVAMDPIALGEFTRGTGPLRAPGLDAAIGPENARRVLLRDIYEIFEDRPAEQNAYLGALIEEFWDGLDEEVDANGLIDGVGAALEGGNFKVFSSRPREQQTLAALESDGRYPPGVTQAVFHNNASANKIDYFLRRTQRTRVELDGDGAARIRVEVVLQNRADPDLDRALLVGPGVAGDEPGTNAMSLFFLLPPGARDASLEVDGAPRDFLFGIDDRSPVVWDVLKIPAQSSVTVVCEYILDLRDGAPASWTLYPQALPRPDRYEFEVVGPDGARLEVTGAPSAGVLDRTRTFTIERK